MKPWLGIGMASYRIANTHENWFTLAEVDIFSDITRNTKAHEATSIEHRIDELNQRIDRLSLITQSLWEMFRDHMNFSETEFRERIVANDESDGAHNAKRSPKVRSCPQCGKNINSAHLYCEYCGSIIEGEITI